MNNHLDPEYDNRVKMLNMEYGERLSSFENVRNKPFRPLKLALPKKKMESTLYSTRCTTDQAIKLDQDYKPDTNEEMNNKKNTATENIKGSSSENEFHQEEAAPQSEDENLKGQETEQPSVV
ncbi:uncharacterized protein LOC123703770 isoform X2 [Colias croceus]|uniref:uncharacterized protein LOC123703770 isoform X2 n=1 Tax=Colias crocea TaxID=72248 RepID=UPI001E27CCD3|nr:uncharacterized protein LOC123703770 isoform X2 [Colias croceus]